MATQKVRPDPDRDERQQTERRQVSRTITFGTIAIAAIVGAIAVLTAVVAVSPEQRTMSTAAVSAAAGGGTQPAEPSADPNPSVAHGWAGTGIPPEGTPLSAPVKGRPIRVHTGYHLYLVVYADGRVLEWNSLRSPSGGRYVLERRLTPEGVGLVRSGVALNELHKSAWAHDGARPYAPPRYSLCFRNQEVALNMIPASANSLLRGNDVDPVHPGCLIVTTKEARSLDKILSEALGPLFPEGFGGAAGVTPGSIAVQWGNFGFRTYLRLLWPDGEWHELHAA